MIPFRNECKSITPNLCMSATIYLDHWDTFEQFWSPRNSIVNLMNAEPKLAHSYQVLLRVGPGLKVAS